MRLFSILAFFLPMVALGASVSVDESATPILTYTIRAKDTSPTYILSMGGADSCSVLLQSRGANMTIAPRPDASVSHNASMTEAGAISASTSGSYTLTTTAGQFSVAFSAADNSNASVTCNPNAGGGGGGAADTLEGTAPASSTENVLGITKIIPNEDPLKLIETTVASPKWVVGTTDVGRYNIDGIKAYCVDDGNGNIADSNKPWFTCPSAGTLKTKTSSLYIDHTNLSPSEVHGLVVDITAGGDTDTNAGVFTIRSSGGSQTGGDEGPNGIRLTTIGAWGAAYGSATVPATTGNYVTVPVTGVSIAQSDYVGIGKNLVLSGSSLALTRTGSTMPPGQRLDANYASAGYSTTGHMANQFNWDVTVALPSSVEADNWCMYDEVNDYYIPGNGTLGHYWLKVSDVSTDGLQFATEWHSQSADYRYPAGLRWSGAYHFAPCYTITSVDQDPSTFVTNSVTVWKTSTAAEGPTTFDVTPYGEHQMTGLKTIQSTRVPAPVDGFVATASLVSETSSGSVGGFYQLDDAFRVDVAGGCMTNDQATSCLVDRTFGAWESGFKVSAGAANTGFDYSYFNHHQGSSNAAIQIRPPTTGSNWGFPNGGNYMVTTRVYGRPEFNIWLNGNRGWGVNGKYWPLITAGTVDNHTDGNVLTWSSSDSAYVETAISAGADNFYTNLPDLGTTASYLATTTGTVSVGGWNQELIAFDLGGVTNSTFTVALPEITASSQVLSKVVIWVSPGIDITVQGHPNDATALGWNQVTTGSGTATMQFVAPATNSACKVEIFLESATSHKVMASSNCTETLSNP